MPWYRIKVDHGPGHQSSTEDYFWADKVLSKEEKEDHFNEFCDWMHDAIGKINMVKTLPSKVREIKIWANKSKIERANEILKVLEETPVRKRNRPKMSRTTYLARVKFDARIRKSKKATWD